MPVSSIQLQFFLSGGSGNSNPNASIGGGISNTPVIGTLNNLFSDLSSSEATSGKTDYRCLYIKNASVSDSLYMAEVYVYSQSSGGSYVQIGTLPVGTLASLIPVETTPPTGVTFTDTSVNQKILVGTIPPQSSVPIWIKRTTDPSTSFKEKDNFVLKISGRPFV